MRPIPLQGRRWPGGDRVLLGLAAAVAAASPALRGQDAPAFAPGEEVRLPWRGLAHDLLVFVPVNHGEVAGGSHPVVFYYPGTGGRPHTRLVRRHTRDRDFVVVGMSYDADHPGSFKYERAVYERERRHLHAVLDHLLEPLALDLSRVYVGGFSKGGWMAGVSANNDLRVSGALIMGAGIFKGELAPEHRYGTPPAVYIGIGQGDGNFPLALVAKLHFARRGANVTLDEWTGIGHGAPRRSPHLEQWLAVRALRPEPDRLRAAAEAWLSQRVATLEADPSPWDRYLGYRKLVSAPFLAELNVEHRRDLAARLDRLRAEPALVQELAAERIYRRIVTHEVNNQTLPELKLCLQGYRDLVEEYPDTHFARVARGHIRRAEALVDVNQAIRADQAKNP